MEDYSKAGSEIVTSRNVEIERDQYLKFFLLSSDIMVIADPNGSFKKVNPACLTLLGYSEEEILGKAFIQFVHQEDKQLTLDEMARQIKSGHSQDFENRYVCKDGSIRWLSWRANYDKTEMITYATARDITERKRTAEALQKAEARITKSLEGLMEGCQILGFDYSFIYINDSAAAQGKKSKQEFIGHKIMDVLPGIEKTEMFAALKICMEERIPQHMENEFTYQDGSKGWFELSFQPIDEGIFILSIDITKRKNAEIALQEKLDELESLNKLMIGREMKMVELKSKNEELKNKGI